jgi:hypothetical protein
MPVNLASKYSPVVDERFAMESRTNIGFNTDYDWVGVQTVNVYTVNTSPLNDYQRTGTSRYGTPEELTDDTQELKLSQDKGFTFIIDRGNDEDQMNVKGAGVALDRQIREVIVPNIDTYRLATLAANAGENDATVATADNAYELFLAGQEALNDASVPEGGRVAFLSNSYYKFLKLDPSFVQSGAMAEISLVRGLVGEVDGVPLITVPKSRLPVGAQFILMHPIAAAAPVKLSEFTIHDNPPGISGNLVEGRVYHDCFVLDNKKSGIYYSGE